MAAMDFLKTPNFHLNLNVPDTFAKWTMLIEKVMVRFHYPETTFYVVWWHKTPVENSQRDQQKHVHIFLPNIIETSPLVGRFNIFQKIHHRPQNFPFKQI